MKKRVMILVTLALWLMLTGMDWKQDTPTDNTGCAGFKPSNYDNPSEGYSQVYTQDYTDDNDSEWDSPDSWDMDHGNGGGEN